MLTDDIEWEAMKVQAQLDSAAAMTDENCPCCDEPVCVHAGELPDGCPSSDEDR